MKLGLSRLSSAAFEQLLAFGATLCGSSNPEQILRFCATFEQNIGLEHEGMKGKLALRPPFPFVFKMDFIRKWLRCGFNNCQKCRKDKKLTDVDCSLI